MQEKHGEAGTDLPRPEERKGRTGESGRRPERAERQERDRVSERERLEPRERQRAIRQIDVQIAAERSRHEGRMDDLQRLRAGARAGKDVETAARADALIRRETSRHEKAMRRLEDRRRELGGAADQGGRRVVEAEEPGDLVGALNALEQEIVEDEDLAQKD